MFGCCQLGGIDLAVPDICKTPMPPPVNMLPIPYPNLCPGLTAVPPCPKVFYIIMPAHMLITKGTLSLGDTAGVLGGLLSGMMMGPNQKLFGSTNVFNCGLPATKMTNPTGNNGANPNAPGLALVPSQPKIMILR